ncbi:MAG TPA: NAD(+)/NADH kinase [Thermoanaerobaculaceae bacterium]|nr:NAD(+)/NADH kinase [Thermoanaerobaculaceae bacterium]HRS16539.1 NAD(+)/NADH kinase [Thermoanaerobaculaceae bacterium]
MDACQLRLPPRLVGVAVKFSSPQAVSLGRRVADALLRRGVEVMPDAESAAVLGLPGGPPRSELGRAVDLVVVVGGDGTFLSAAHGCPASTPVAGINMGTLGFLTEHPSDRADDFIEDVLAGRVELQRRDRLEVRVGDGEAGEPFLVLNDVVINKAALARMIAINVEVAEEHLSLYRADGLILSTPTGSTAYNLSAGGPIVHPGLAAVVITPICPHTLSNRPLVIPSGLEVAVRLVRGDEGVYLTLDGQQGLPLRAGPRVRVRVADEPLWVVRDRNASFFSTLHHKLKWGEREG